MPATLIDPIKMGRDTNITAREQIMKHRTSITLAAHTRSILGRNYWQLLKDPDISQLNSNTLLIR